MVLDLNQGECKTLIVGDVLRFLSEPETYYYCVVAFYDAIGEVGDDLNLEGVVSGRAGRREGVEVVDGGENSCADMTQEVVNVDDENDVTVVRDDMTSATRDNDVSVDTSKTKTMADKDVKPSKPVESTKMDIESDTRNAQEHVESVNQPKASVKEEAIVNAAKTKPDSVEESTRQTPVLKKSPVKFKSPSRISVGASITHGIAAPKLTVNPAQSVKKGDYVRVVYQLADAFGIEHEEW